MEMSGRYSGWAALSVIDGFLSSGTAAALVDHAMGVTHWNGSVIAISHRADVDVDSGH